MLREFTCIMCPQGCEIVVETEKEAAGTGKALEKSDYRKPMSAWGGVWNSGNGKSHAQHCLIGSG